MKDKTFLRITIVTTLCIVLLNLLVTEVFTRKVLIPNDIVTRKEKMLEEVQYKIKIVSLGDSHIQSGITLGSDEFFNLAGEGEPIPIWYFKIKRLLNSPNNVNVILLQMDYHIFSHYRTVNVEAATMKYATYIDEKIDRKLGVYPEPSTPQYIKLYSLQPNYAPIVHSALRKYIRKELKAPILANNGAEVSIKKFINLPEIERTRIAERRVQLHLQNGDLIDPNLLSYYERIIQLAESHGVKVILIRSPLSKEYQSFISEPVKQDIDKLASQIRLKYNLPLLDYRTAFNDQQENFLDEDHLNSDGSKILGQLIIKDLKKFNIEVD